MPKDDELDRLKAVLDEKFNAKQKAYDSQDSAWKTRSAAKEALSRAYDEKTASV